jgi:hypothetical protein
MKFICILHVGRDGKEQNGTEMELRKRRQMNCAYHSRAIAGTAPKRQLLQRLQARATFDALNRLLQPRAPSLVQTVSMQLPSTEPAQASAA